MRFFTHQRIKARLGSWFLRCQRGFSLLELVVVLCVVSVVGYVVFERVLIYQELAEKASVDITVMHLRNSLRYRVAELLLHHQEKNIVDVVGINPVVLLESPPPNYVGELKHAKWDEIQLGSWYFDSDSGELVYRVKNARHFVSSANGMPGLRFRVTATFHPADAKRRLMQIEGLRLSLMTPYQWVCGDK